MNLLLDSLPDEVIIHDTPYQIHTDFRVGIQFELMMDTEKSEYEKIKQAFSLYYDVFPDDLELGIQKVIWFYLGGDTNTNSDSKGGMKDKKIYSYEYDQNLIYTAFLQHYHIDLNTIMDLHWWKFRQLFFELPKESSIKQAMMYRSMQLNSNMSSEQRSFYAQMKYLYRLPDDRTKEEKAQTFASILANGMKIIEQEVKENE